MSASQCRFEHGGQRCVFGAQHTINYHHFHDGTSAPGGEAWVWDDELTGWRFPTATTTFAVTAALGSVPSYTTVEATGYGIIYWPATGKITL